MSMYILLLTLTPEGRERTLRDPESVLRTGESIDVPGIQVLGMYGVLGNYDFVSIVEAPDNEAVARFSLELGVKAGVHVTTLPAIPVTRLEGISPRDPMESEVTATPEPSPSPTDGRDGDADSPRPPGD